MTENSIGLISPALQETATAGTYAQAEFFQPLAGKLPAAGDTGIVMDGVFHPALDGSPKPGDIVALATVPVTPAEQYCLQLEDVQVLPSLTTLPAMRPSSITNIIDPDRPGETRGLSTQQLEFLVMSDTPTEDDPDFDPADKDDPGYIRNDGIRFYTPSHAEYAPDKFNHTEGVGYIYAFNEDIIFPRKIYDDALPAYEAAYTAAQQATTAAHQHYLSASYTMQLPGVLQQQSQARQEAYDASYNTARAELTAAEEALVGVQAQRDAAAQEAYNTAYADYAQQIAAAQAEEQTAAAAYYAAESAAYQAAQDAYDAVITGGGSEGEAQQAYDQAYQEGYAAVDAAMNEWWQKMEAVWTLQWQADEVCYTAYQTEYDNWASAVAAAQTARDSAAASFNEAEARNVANAVGDAAAAAYDGAVEAAQQHDEELVPQYRAADYRAWLDAQEAERVAKLKYHQAQILTTRIFRPHPALRCPPTDIAHPYPCWTNPDFPLPAEGIVWNGKPFTPPERLLPTNTTAGNRPFLILGVRAYRRGRLLSNRKVIIIQRIPGKIVIEYEKSTRKLKVTTPYSTYAKITATYVSTGAHLLLDAESGTEAVVNANDTINISFRAPNDAIADYWVQQCLRPITVPINVLGEELTEDFTRTVWNQMPERGQATRTVAVRLTEKPDYYMSANGTGDGLTPENPTSWDALLTPVALLGNTGGGLALTGKVVWLSGDPVTSQSAFKIPYGNPTPLVIKGGFNSDFTAVTGYSLLTKKTEMPGGTLMENFRATAPNIFSLISGSAYGTFRNCKVECSGWQENPWQGNRLFEGSAIELIGCTVQYTGVPATIFAGQIRNCSIAGNICSIGGRIMDSQIHISGVSKFVYPHAASPNVYPLLTEHGIAQTFPGDAHVHAWLDELIRTRNSDNPTQAPTKKINLEGIGHVLSSGYGAWPLTQYTGSTGYFPGDDRPFILNSTLVVDLQASDGADGANGTPSSWDDYYCGQPGGDGECICFSFPPAAVNSNIVINAGKPGDGGKGGDGLTHPSRPDRYGYAGRGGRGGSCVIILPLKLRNTTITLNGGGFGLGGDHGISKKSPIDWGGSNTTYAPWYIAYHENMHHNRIKGHPGRFYIRRPLYWDNAQFPTDPQDDLLPRYLLNDVGLNTLNGYYENNQLKFSWRQVRGTNHLASDIGRTALPEWWGSNGRQGIPGSYGFTTVDGYEVFVKGLYGSDGGMPGCGCPMPGLASAGIPGEGAPLSGIAGPAGLVAGEFWE